MARRMPSDQRRSRKRKAFVLGGTGEVGKALVKELAQTDDLGEVCLISRRHLEIPTPEQQPGYAKFRQTIIDFEQMSEFAEAFSGYDIGFCALGATASQSDRSGGIYRVDHDYALGAAKLAKAGGCEQFLIVTSSKSKRRSMYNYLRIKRIVESELIQHVCFQRLSIFRPASLLCKRVESKPSEACFRCFARVFDCGHCMSIEVSILARAMVKIALEDAPITVQTFENEEIHRIGRN